MLYDVTVTTVQVRICSYALCQIFEEAEMETSLIGDSVCGFDCSQDKNLQEQQPRRF